MNVPARAVFLDRDGVLNHAIVRAGRPYPPAGLSEIELLPGVRKACAALRAAGYLLIVVTNQPDIARGKQTREAVDAMNGWMQRELALDQVQVCPHDDRDACACRKPAPGMLRKPLDSEYRSRRQLHDRGPLAGRGRRGGAPGAARSTSTASTAKGRPPATTMRPRTCPPRPNGFSNGVG